MPYNCVIFSPRQDEMLYPQLEFPRHLIGPPLTPTDCNRVLGRIDSISTANGARIRVDFEEGRIYFSPGEIQSNVPGIKHKTFTSRHQAEQAINKAVDMMEALFGFIEECRTGMYYALL
jgi:hypothetical protein